MEIEEVFNKLIKAYSDENLNHITGKLILLYKNKNYSKIREIIKRISEFIPIDDEKDAKSFSKLMMLYHPDKGEQSRKLIQTLYKKNDFENLQKHSHILLLSDIDNIAAAEIDENIGFEPEYTWDTNANDGFSFTDSSGETDLENESTDIQSERSFYNLVKLREYGTLDIEFPPYYLHDFEEFEMAHSGLESLEGVEHCIHMRILDVSDNSISDIGRLWDLQSLEELYLANNQIGYIDTLDNLIKLKVLDLSGNQINDITPLLSLPHLEYVNLIGNPITINQIELLKNKGTILMI
ncbi:MAG: leucine-rich repeat domain-containing protein [Ekhidna sp.]